MILRMVLLLLDRARGLTLLILGDPHVEDCWSVFLEGLGVFRFDSLSSSMESEG